MGILRAKNLIRNLNYLSKHSLWDQREVDIAYLTNKILDDALYEFEMNSKSRAWISVLDVDLSLKKLEKCPKSFVRTSDGEVKIMMGMDQPFQRYEPDIAEHMMQFLRSDRDDLYVGINRDYFVPLTKYATPTDAIVAYNRRNAYDYRQIYLKYLNCEKTYLDTNFTAYPIGQKRTKEYDDFFLRWRKLFENKDIVIVCGEGILDKLEYDVFGLAKSKKFIYGPRRHAWDKHREIVREIEDTVGQDSLVVFILGMAGKAMIPELTDEGYMCWDVGHLAKYYDSYMKEAEATTEYVADFFAPD